ncbi:MULTISPECIES: NAD-dependent succinate-semialdehyde dehydrogenase [unclassified Variovorax]|jgi:succinate-semialdehyde dehydrogenase / glutarate-semialdehyde dehydrogenase|uniref:NAD-dependent succinate-semialdehyde dehydrogenase n=1 Tax=unclassified Variovorax TaxID=663243 RepID=UPI00086DAF31|nr:MULTISPECIES: NAD-dependent succinate-semialdehyde dehydrogenase [unclassified Variovorax]MBN8758480.1 NAD-dependent succinate-semialdehyde dehydrogenase [Variovorax sp.]ODU18863.1 MAG: succinate-semialdehyde dehydrogenase (NADP(+)) [Variovorax sp. SCN 67-85]ODV18306.1 MAG: succinate-semialdehyde dehydrogenase (NADP(+)) [Variovorax sp. SCN 67-20]OJZ05845.1 MAG: succinate-semialdehyde dehydrogenase (NADP(+)) [Variovorax sp. 67-131]
MLNQLRDPSLLKSACLVNGVWLAADNGTTLDVTNPSTGAVIGTVPNMAQAETQRAIDAADRAFRGWRRETADSRAMVLRRWFELLMQHQEDLALIMTTEQGKPLTESRGEIAYAASYIQWFGEEARRIYGSVVPSPWADKQIIVIKEPVGVCAAITPWNFPAAMITRKVAPALAAGCTIIVKPAQQTPLTALALAELAVRAGVPAGVLSVLTGSSRAIGGVLTGSMDVRKLTFTGSTEVGRVLAEQCAPTLKKMSLELGGNAPFIVFDDADLDAAVVGAMASKYRNTGQTCVCANRLLVQEGVYDAFMAKLKVAVEALKVGDGLTPDAEQGPLIDQGALDKVEELVADALSQGAGLVSGGKRHALGGTFYEPTILGNATPAMRIANEEVFGPVAAVFRFKTEGEAIQMANDTEYGLAAYFYARDIGRVWRVGGALEYGMVGINSGIISTAVAPFGGVKQSGIGREGGEAGIEEYVSTKYLCMGS